MGDTSPSRCDTKISYNFPPLEIVSRPSKVVSAVFFYVVSVKLSQERNLPYWASQELCFQEGEGLLGVEPERQQLGTDGIHREDTPFSILLILQGSH